MSKDQLQVTLTSQPNASPPTFHQKAPMPKSSEALKWHLKGLSLREIGEQLDCSHQQVKRLLDQEQPLPTFRWSEVDMSPFDIKKRLRKMLKEHCGKTWLKVPDRWSQDWIYRCLATLFDPVCDDAATVNDRFSQLLDSGPSRPGRRRSYENASANYGENNWWKHENPISSFIRRNPDGTQIAYGDLFDKVLIDSKKRAVGHARSSHQPLIAPSGKPFQPCPICHEPTAYLKPSCTVRKNGEVDTADAELAFKSKYCHQGICDNQKRRPDSMQNGKTYAPGFQERRFRLVTSSRR
jgi:hypothetical protein